MGYWGWGAVLADLDLDGWLDLVETNGCSTSSSDKPARLWCNIGVHTFSEVTAAASLDDSR